MLNCKSIGGLGLRVAEMYGRVLSARGRRVAIRIAVVLIALGILYLRMPGSFTYPQLYGEDNDFLYVSRAHDWSSLVTVIAGWLAVVQFLVAILASYFSVALAPTIYNYAAFALTLLVVWMVMSPRLDMPYKPLLAIAVVVVPMGYEELGTLTNSQWILPIGAFALLFMPAARSPLVLAGEALFLTVTSLSGPFAIFYTPLYLWCLLRAREPVERHRLVVLTAIVAVSALIQVIVLARNPSVLNLVPPTPYPWTVWINLPFTQFMTTFGFTSGRFQGVGAAVLGGLLFAVMAALAWLPPYRTQKILILLFALAIAAAGMFKFRAALEGQFASQRYFYAGCVFVLWFICCVTDRRYLRTVLAAIVALTELMLLPVVANTPRFAKDQEWPVWSSYITSGLPIIIPTTPPGFYLSLPATLDGPLAQFRSWMGRDIADVAGRKDASACTGVLDPVETAGMIYLQPVRGSKDLWITRGTAWDAARNRPVQLIALIDAADRVIGFGLPGFKTQEPASPALSRSRWNSIFYADPGTTVRAYGVLDDGHRVCPLANRRHFPNVVKSLGSNQFIGAAEITPNNAIVQRFKPIQRVEEITVRFVTYGRKPSSYSVDWKIVGSSHGHAIELGSGRVDAGTIKDWQQVELPMPIIPDGLLDQIELSFRVGGTGSPAAPIGIPLYRPANDSSVPPAQIGAKPATSGGVLGLISSYDQ